MEIRKEHCHPNPMEELELVYEDVKEIEKNLDQAINIAQLIIIKNNEQTFEI